MLPVNEGNDECWKCKHFDLGSGCIPAYAENGLPPCGRDIIMTQECFKKLMARKDENHGKRRFFKFMQKDRG